MWIFLVGSLFSNTPKLETCWFGVCMERRIPLSIWFHLTLNSLSTMAKSSEGFISGSPNTYSKLNLKLDNLIYQTSSLKNWNNANHGRREKNHHSLLMLLIHLFEYSISSGILDFNGKIIPEFSALVRETTLSKSRFAMGSGQIHFGIVNFSLAWIGQLDKHFVR